MDTICSTLQLCLAIVVRVHRRCWTDRGTSRRLRCRRESSLVWFDFAETVLLVDANWGSLGLVYSLLFGSRMGSFQCMWHDMVIRHGCDKYIRGMEKNMERGAVEDSRRGDMSDCRPRIVCSRYPSGLAIGFAQRATNDGQDEKDDLQMVHKARGEGAPAQILCHQTSTGTSLIIKHKVHLSLSVSKADSWLLKTPKCCLPLIPNHRVRQTPWRTESASDRFHRPQSVHHPSLL